MNSKKSIIATMITAATTLTLAVIPSSVPAADSQMEWRLTHPAPDSSQGLEFSSSAGDQEGFYLGADAGLALIQDLTLKDTDGAKMSFNPGARLDLSLGYHFTNGISYGFGAGFIYNSVDRIAGISLGDVGASADFYQFPLLVDLKYTHTIYGPIKGFIGGSMGAVIGRFSGSSPGGDVNHTDYTFAYQGMTGIKYEFNDRMDLGLTYKFLGTTDHSFGSGIKSGGTMAHCIMVCFQMNL